MAQDDKQMKREEEKIEGNVNYKVDDPRFIEMDKWPVILLDTTGSMNEPTSSGGQVTRKETSRHCLATLIDMLAPVDTVDQINIDPNSAWKGVTVVTFNGMDRGVNRGLIHLGNLAQEWSKIRFHGATHVMDGWRTMLDSYERQFFDKPQFQRPLLLAVIITDGELQDAKEFEDHLKRVRGKVFVEIAVVGFGEDHDRALKHYQKITKKHDHVRATAFTNETDPANIARQLLSAVDPRLIKQSRPIAQLEMILNNPPIYNNVQQPPPYNPGAQFV